MLVRSWAAAFAVVLWLCLAGPSQAQSNLPDLVVRSVVLDTEQPGGCDPSGASLGLRVTVQNVGGGGANPFAVEVNGRRQRVGGLAPGQSLTLWFSGYSGGLNRAIVDVQLEVLEANEGNNELSQQLTGIPPAATCTPTSTPQPTATPIFTVTPAPPATATFTPVPTATPSGGVRMVVTPNALRINPGQTVLIQVNVEWNPTGQTVALTHAAADAVSAAVTTNATWSPTRQIVGTGLTQLVLGTSTTLSPGVYTVNITGKTSLGQVVQPVRLEVLPSGAQFDDEVQRRGEYGVLGPEVIAPYRGGDGFVYQSRVHALLQWRPEEKTYFHVNTSELLDLSGVAASQHRLPPAVVDDGSDGDWGLAVAIRFGWLTDPAIRARYLAPPPAHTGSWDQNGSIVFYGLPASRPTQLGPYVVQRFQRAVLRHWIADPPSHPEWRDSVAVVPLHQAVLNFIPEIDPSAAAQIVRSSRPTGRPTFGGWWEVDGSGANGFASAALEGDDPFTARVALANPTATWLEATLIGPVGTLAALAPGQSVASDWPGAAPLTWLVEPGERIALNLHQNEVHPDPVVRSASVMHLWVRPTARSAMARVVQGLAAVGAPEVGELHGARLTAFYRAMLAAAQRSGAGRVGCLIALDGDVSAGDERAFDQNLACAVREPVTGRVLAEAASALGVDVNEEVIHARLDLDALRARLSPDPAVGWFWWNLQLDGREPGGRVRVSRTGLRAES